MSDLTAELFQELNTLSRRVWEGNAKRAQIERWLNNFVPDAPSAPDPSERLHALYLLAHFMYFGARETRALLRALYRELVRYPVVAEVRKALNDSRDVELLEQMFEVALQRTRFIGIGNPSDSGSYLLYHFRQENKLSRQLFISAHQILDRATGTAPSLRVPEVTRYIFLDDFCGSGQQAEDFSKQLVEELKTVSARQGFDVVVAYYVLVATSRGLDAVRARTKFDDVRCIVELDETFRCFSPNSRYFRNAPKRIDASFAEQMSYYYGSQLFGGPHGFGDSQLLIGFHHNTPDNTLPIFWYDEPRRSNWQPIFRRYHKKY